MTRFNLIVVNVNVNYSHSFNRGKYQTTIIRRAKLLSTFAEVLYLICRWFLSDWETTCCVSQASSQVNSPENDRMSRCEKTTEDPLQPSSGCVDDALKHAAGAKTQTKSIQISDEKVVLYTKTLKKMTRELLVIRAMCCKQISVISQTQMYRFCRECARWTTSHLGFMSVNGFI